MIRTITALVITLFLVGCADTQYVVKTQIVDKPVLVCPAPPTIEPIEFQVSKLTAEDAKDPGKVAQAYKADMLYLRRMEGVYNDIIKTYKEAAEAAAKARESVDKIFQNKAAEPSQPVPPSPTPNR